MGYDMNTKNKSFIRMREYLQDHDIENNLFMLETKNEELMGIDLYEELKKLEGEPREKFLKKIIIECNENIWFYLREVVRINNPFVYTKDDVSYEDSNRFVLNPYFMDVIYLYQNNINIFFQSSAYTQGEHLLMILAHYQHFIAQALDKPCGLYCDGNYYYMFQSNSYILNYINSEILPPLINYVDGKKYSYIHEYGSDIDTPKSKIFLSDFEFIEDPLHTLFSIDKDTHIIMTSDMNNYVDDDFIGYLENRCPLFDISLYDNKNMIESYEKSKSIVYIHYTSKQIDSIYPTKGYGCSYYSNILSKR